MSRDELLGELAEHVIEIFRHVQREVLVPNPGLIHVSQTEANVMRVIVTSPGATVSEIARAFGQHTSNTSVSIASLVDKGLVEKRSSPADGRKVRVYPTELADKNFVGHRAAWARLLDPATNADPDRLRSAVDLLASIAVNLNEGDAPTESS